MSDTNPTPTQPETLEPCPFCPDGGDPYLHDMQFGTRAHDVAVRCRKCGASANSYSWASGLTHLQDERYAEARRKAVVAWNTRRAAVTAPRGVIELLSASLLHPESAEGYVRQAIEMLSAAATSSPTPAAPSVVDAIAELIKMRDEYADDERVTRPVNTLNAAIERLAFANSNATPPERTRVAGEQE